MKIRITICCIAAVMLCAAAWAQEGTGASSVTCQQGDLSRVVEVTYAGAQGEAPCEVHYKKTVEQPGHDEILWSAEHESGYCKTKQREFVAKLESWGWNCQ